MTGPRLAVIYCGGTIGMLPTDVGGLGLVAGAKADQLSLRSALGKAGLPDSSDWFPIRAVGLTVGKKAAELPAIDSSAVDAYYWQCLVTTILQLPAAYDSVLVLHGTDTMAYTAAALSIALAAAEFSRSVVITGSQRPIRTADGGLDITSDGVANIRDAVAACTAAVAHSAGLLSPLVQLVFAGDCLHGARCSKVHSKHDHGFSERQLEPDKPDMGEPQLENREPKKAMIGVGDVAVFCNGVADIVINPGLEASQLAHMLSTPELKAAVIRLYGSGTINPEHLNALRVDIPLLAVSACFEGGVQVACYSTSAISHDANPGRVDGENQTSGLINGGVMSPEMALVKLMWVMADPSRERAPAYWLTRDIAGEFGR